MRTDNCKTPKSEIRILNREDAVRIIETLIPANMVAIRLDIVEQIPSVAPKQFA